LFNKLCSSADVWVGELATARDAAEELQQKISNLSDSTMREDGLNHTTRRYLNRNTERNITDNMATFRRYALADISRLGHADDFDSMLLAPTSSASEEIVVRSLAKLAKGRFADSHEAAEQNRRAIGVVNVGNTRAMNPYHRVFMYEMIARHELAQLMRQAPQFGLSLLEAGAIDDLPEAVKRLIAVDIAAGPKSIIANTIKNRSISPVSFSEYISQNNLTDPVKQLVSAISLGAKAIGGCDCPLNEFGLCRRVTDNITFEDLPLDIQKSMSQRENTANAQLMQQLKAFAAQNRTSKWWTMTANISSQEMGQATSKSTKKRVGSAAVQTVAQVPFRESLAPIKTGEILGPDTVLVGWKGGEEVVRADLSDSKAVDSLVDQILQTAQFARYIEQYRSQKGMPELLRQGLGLILAAPSYREEGSLVRMRRYKPHYSDKKDSKQAMTPWRWSGRYMKNIAGKEGQDTRIYFAVKSDGRTRRVEIIKVDSKHNVDKSVPRAKRL